MAEDIENDFKQIKVSRLTLGLIMSVAVTSGVVVWNAAQVAGRIGELEDSVNRIQMDMDDVQATDPTILIRLDDLEEKIDELDRENGEELRWEIDDLHHRSYAFEQAIRSRAWGDEALREFLGW